MKQKSFYHDFEVYTPFIIVDECGSVAFSNPFFSQCFGDEFTPQMCEQLIKMGELPRSITVDDKTYTVCEEKFNLGERNYRAMMFTLSEKAECSLAGSFCAEYAKSVVINNHKHFYKITNAEYEPLLMMILRTADQKRACKRPINLRTAFISWSESISCELNTLIDARVASNVASNTYVSVCVQGLFVALTTVYKQICLSGRLSDAQVLLSNENDIPCISFNCKSTLDITADWVDNLSPLAFISNKNRFFCDFLIEISISSNFKISFYNLNGMFSLKFVFSRFSTDTFSLYANRVGGEDLLVRLILRELFD